MSSYRTEGTSALKGNRSFYVIDGNNTTGASKKASAVSYLTFNDSRQFDYVNESVFTRGTTLKIGVGMVIGLVLMTACMVGLSLF